MREFNKAVEDLLYIMLSSRKSLYGVGGGQEECTAYCNWLIIRDENTKGILNVMHITDSKKH